MKMNLKKGLARTKLSGFTLIELLVVVAIIALLASVVLVSLGIGKDKTIDTSVKSNLRNAIGQAEIFYTTNTVARNTYTNVCSTTSPIGGAKTIVTLVNAAAKTAGMVAIGADYYTQNPGGSGGSLTTATCNDSVNAWAAEVPLKSASGMWCVDSTGKSKQEATSIGTTTVCP